MLMAKKTRATPDPTQHIDELLDAVYQLYSLGRDHEAIAVAFEIRALALENLGKNHPRFAPIMKILVVLHQEIGKIKCLSLGENHLDPKQA
jgi:hypothetical protein